MHHKMNRTSILMLVALSALSAPSFADESELQRLVVTHASSANSVSTHSLSKFSPEQCFTISGQSLCVPGAEQQSVSAMDRGAKASAAGSITAIDVPSGISVDDAIAVLSASGYYKSVERDVFISNGEPKPMNGSSTGIQTQSFPKGEPNDPSFFEQKFYFGPHSATSPVGVGVLNAWTAATSVVEPIDVIIMDGGFMTRDDIVYASGYNFSKKNAVRGPEFLTASSDATCSGHGLGVASVVGAKINNGLNLSGMVSDVNIHALKTMDCYGGYMSDAADTLLWLAGTTFPDIPAYTGKPGVVNMSLGGAVDNCPAFMQTAIDAAVAAGFSIVVSAGNDNVNVSGSAPANCANVVTVSALHNDGNKSDFSNYGEKVTVAAPGYDVVGLCGQSADDICFWGGTSFSSPIVAGALAIARQHGGLKVGSERLMLELSANPIADANGECAALGCGKGIVDVGNLVTLSKSMNMGAEAKIEYALAKESACSQSWLVKHGQSVKMCDLLTVDLVSFTNDPRLSYTLEAKLATTTEYTPVVEITSTSTNVVISDVLSALGASDAKDLSFEYKVCAGDTCQNFPINSTKLQPEFKPASCN